MSTNTVWSDVIAGDVIIHSIARYCWCGTRLSRYNAESVCFAHIASAKKFVEVEAIEPEERKCSTPGCTKRPHIGKSMCSICAVKAKRKAIRAAGPHCSRPGCNRHLISTNRTGMCSYCANCAESQLARYYKRRGLNPVIHHTCSADGCTNKLSIMNLSGVCWHHGATERKRERRHKKMAEEGKMVRAYLRKAYKPQVLVEA